MSLFLSGRLPMPYAGMRRERARRDRTRRLVMVVGVWVTFEDKTGYFAFPCRSVFADHGREKLPCHQARCRVFDEWSRGVARDCLLGKYLKMKILVRATKRGNVFNILIHFLKIILMYVF